MREEWTQQILNDQKRALQSFDATSQGMSPGDSQNFLDLMHAMQALQARNMGLDTKLERRVAFTRKLLQEIR